MPQTKDEVKPFVNNKELSGTQKAVSGMAAPVRLLAGAALIGGAAFAGMTAGGQVPGKFSTAGKAVGGVTLGAAAAFAATKIDQERKDVAIIELENALCGRDPSTLTASEVSHIGDKNGVNLTADYRDQMKNMYDHYLSNVLPPGDLPLGGWEAEALLSFKSALGLDDQDAADVHIEVGRRIFRMRFEVGGKEAEQEERRAFQKLVFVSNMVFGDAKSKFLLPWKRLFNVTDAQILVACRDNGASLYKRYLESLIPEDRFPADATALKAAREYQSRISLSDEVATDTFQSLVRGSVEKTLADASEALKSSGRTKKRDVTGAMGAVEEVLAYNHEMTTLGGEEGVASGTGPVTLWGGVFHEENRMEELRGLYRMYFAENVKDGIYTEDTKENIDILKNVFGLGAKEAEEIVTDVSTKVYRNKIRKAMSSGDLDAAESKAKFLQELCDNLQFAPESAFAVNASFYEDKLGEFLEKKRLSEEDVAELLRLRVLLCVPEATVKKAHTERCGAIFRDTLEAAISVGLDGFSFDQRDRVVKCAQNLKLDKDLAIELLGVNVRKAFAGMIKTAKNKSTRLEQAKELKKMVFFSNLVVSPLIEGIRPEDPEKIAAAEKAEAEMKAIMEEAKKMAKAEGGDDDEEEPEISIAKPEKEKIWMEGKEVEVKPQKEINMSTDLDLAERQELYKTYLLYCMSGDQVDLPMGGKVTIERDESEFKRLAQLGDVLGLSPMDVNNVQKGLAEQAFTQNVKQVLGDGNLTAEKSEYLKGVQKQMNLTDESAQLIIRGVTNERVGSNVAAQVSAGKMDLKEIRNLKEQDLDVESMVSKEQRKTLFRKEVEKLLTAGTGNFDANEMLVEVPELLCLDKEKAATEVEQIAKERKKDALVSGVAMLRSKDVDETLKCINNLIACNKAAPDTKVSWPLETELQDLYSIYIMRKGDSKEVLQDLLSISDETAQNLEAVVEAGTFNLAEEEESEEEALF
ncbi:hypothetical protein CYMTET_42978 [Cymbomonas tetramitiformis]|uniref:Uncharacterized protein n=1 Tax=Cymbomonas tetramitiformis TaxID=36881 RepID=A0AAE0F238_9CHLO|nr:hypothetical protein CYMTET_42978 [Cymbomonas tetramitiformis]